jgi:F-type H+-transporting ATPase subunit gamma
MATLLDFRRRIRSVKNTQQITRAMKFIAAARLRRAQEKASSLRPYAEGIREVLRSAMSRIENPEQFPLLAQRPEERVLVLVTSGERGLCGAFNANVLWRAVEFLAEKEDKSVEVITIAKKSRDFFRRRSWKIAHEYVDITTSADLGKAREIAAEVMKIYEDGQADSVYLIYNEFKNVLMQTLRVEKLLPLERAEPVAPGKDAPPVSSADVVDYIYEQPAAEIFSKMVPRHVETQIYRMLAESSAAEHAARMTAMDSATSNAGEVIDALTMHMNKVRQAAITREIIEVVSGAASVT